MTLPGTGSVVVKLGGSLLENAVTRAAVLRALARLAVADGAFLLVHGGGRRIDAALAARGIPKRVSGGLRVTDDATLEAVVTTLKAVNRGLVDELRELGAPAVGLTGLDAGALRASPHPPVDGVDLGRVGVVTGVDARVFDALWSAGALPVLAPLALGRGGAPLNVNADTAAAAIAAAVGARRLIFLTDVEGISDGLGRRIERLDPETASRLLAGASISGGMRPKLAACVEAASAGVGEVVIAGPGRQEEALAGGRGGTHVLGG